MRVNGIHGFYGKSPPKTTKNAEISIVGKTWKKSFLEKSLISPKGTIQEYKKSIKYNPKPKMNDSQMKDAILSKTRSFEGEYNYLPQKS